jgi:hypothetical protein
MSSHHANDHSFKALSRDEMNLVEFPISVLSKRTDPTIKTLEFTDFVTSKNGDNIERKWIITGADKFGLPTSSDDEVLLGLLKLSVDKGFSERKIYFTRYELLRVLKWSTEGRSYTRLQKALDRLSGVRIKTINGFFDNESKRHTTRNFGLIDEYEINSHSGGDLPNSFFVWSDVMFRSFQVGFIKRLDLDFYLELKTAVAKRLFRYLDKHFWYKSSLRKNLFSLCHEKIGVSRNFKYSSSLLQQIEPGVEELIQKGFLKKFECFGKGRHLEVVFYSSSQVLGTNEDQPVVLVAANNGLSSDNNSHNSSVRPAPCKSTPEMVEDGQVTSAGFYKNLSDDLIARGLRPSQVSRLLSGLSGGDLRKAAQIVNYFDYLCTQKSKLVSKSPVGFLYRAVESIDAFTLPDYFVSKPKEPLPVKRKTNNYGIPSECVRVELAIEPEEEIDPAELLSVRAQVERAMVKMKGVISEQRYEEVVAHGVQRKLAGLKRLNSLK